MLSTLLVAVLTIKARVTRQSAHAQRRLEAVAAADRLLATWWLDVRTFPRSGAGLVPGDASLAWRTALVPNATLNAMSACVVRLEVTDARGDRAIARVSVLASVEVVLDDAPEPTDRSARPELAHASGGTAP